MPKRAAGDVKPRGDVAPKPAEIEQPPSGLSGVAARVLFVFAVGSLVDGALALRRTGWR
jgi:hypothetical protein